MPNLSRKQYGIISIALLILVLIVSIVLFNNGELQKDKPDAVIKSTILTNTLNVEISQNSLESETETNLELDSVQNILKDAEKETIDTKPQLITITVLVTEVLENNSYVGDITMSNVAGSYTDIVEFSTEGLELDFEIKEGTIVEIDYNGIMTRSIPPIISIINIKYYGEALDNQYSEVKNIDANDIIRGSLDE